MKRAHIWPIAMCLVPVAAACTDGFLGPEPADDPETNFEILWGEVDRHYAYFREKDVDWGAVYAAFRPSVHAGTTPQELFQISTQMLGLLRDGHVNLHAPGIGDWYYDAWWRVKPTNYRENVVLGYLTGRASVAGGQMYYGRLPSGMGYLRIKDFGGSGWGEAIDEVLVQLDNIPAMVVDVRGNGGGSDLLSDVIAGRFADEKRPAEVVRYRDGPKHDDFTDPIERFVEPGGRTQFTRPVALLTDRGVFSTGESFVLSMRVLPHVTVVVDSTGGGAGNPLARELPNGWSFRVSRWQSTTPEGISYEGIGLVPDVVVWITAEDQARARDTILDRALELLAERIRTGGG